jgi:hypothetical protein
MDVNAHQERIGRHHGGMIAHPVHTGASVCARRPQADCSRGGGRRCSAPSVLS